MGKKRGKRQNAAAAEEGKSSTENDSVALDTEEACSQSINAPPQESDPVADAVGSVQSVAANENANGAEGAHQGEDEFSSPRGRKEEVVKVRAENRRLTVELDRLSQEVQNLQLKIDTTGLGLQEQLDAALDEKDATEQELEKARAEVSIMSRQLKIAEVERDEGNSVIAHLRKELKDLKQQRDSEQATQRSKSMERSQALEEENAQLKQTLFFTVALHIKSSKVEHGERCSIDVQSLYERWLKENGDGIIAKEGRDKVSMTTWILNNIFESTDI